jgi:hypothetical protein
MDILAFQDVLLLANNFQSNTPLLVLKVELYVILSIQLFFRQHPVIKFVLKALTLRFTIIQIINIMKKTLYLLSRGLPKNKALIKFLSEEGIKQLLQKT